MIIVDTALRARAAAGNPIRVALVGAGFMGRATVNQIASSVPGMAVVAVASRRIGEARRAYEEAGVAGVVEVGTVARLEHAIEAGRPAVTDDAMLLCRAAGVDCLVDMTGAIEFGAALVLEAMAHGKHVVTFNAELDGTLGPILQTYARRAGVVLSVADGDQPGVQMNLYRFVTGIGMRPLVIGNIKGLQDPYRTPATQEAFARQWGQKPDMVTSFADGTKIAFEQAIVANATGFRVPRRGMFGWDHPGHVDELTTRYDHEQLRRWGGIVDYTVGSQPAPGVYIVAEHALDDPKQRRYLALYKLGDGPLYSFYTPYHLCHFEVPFSVARAVLFGDAAVSPRGAPCVDVVATAKTDLAAGTVLDGIGGYHAYGQAENADVAAAESLLPIGLAEGCRLVRDVPRDRVLTRADVEIPAGRLVDRLRAEQDAHFPAATTTARGPRPAAATSP